MLDNHHIIRWRFADNISRSPDQRYYTSSLTLLDRSTEVAFTAKREELDICSMLVISGASNDSCDEGWGVMARQWQICQNENVSLSIGQIISILLIFHSAKNNMIF